MGNLRDKYTDDEWADIEERIHNERINGKPDDTLLYLSVWDKSADELVRIRAALSEFYDDYELGLLDRWIEWKRKA